MIFFDIITLAVIGWMIYKGQKDGFVSQLLGLIGICIGVLRRNCRLCAPHRPAVRHNKRFRHRFVGDHYSHLSRVEAHHQDPVAD